MSQSQGNREIEGARRNLESATILYRSLKERRQCLVQELAAVESSLESAKQRREDAKSFLADAEQRNEVIHIDADGDDDDEGISAQRSGGECTEDDPDYEGNNEKGTSVAEASPCREEEASFADPDEEEDSDYEPRANVVTPPKKKRRTDAPGTSSTSASRRLGLDKEGPAWLEDFHHFLLHVPHGDGKKKKTVSEANARTVMGKVRKLTTGTGVNYKQWPTGTVFAKDRPIDLSTDLKALYQEAVDFEEMYGKDKGHGWLLLHPIKKMQLYANYVQGRS